MKKNILLQGRNKYVVAVMWTDNHDKGFKFLTMETVNANSKEIAIKKYLKWVQKKGHCGYDMYVEYPEYDIKVEKI